MKFISTILKKFFKWLLILFVLLNILILISGKAYLYKGFSNTYLKGRTTASIYEYKIFDNNIVAAGHFSEWAVGKDYNTKKVPAEHLSYVNALNTVAYLIIKDDSIRYEEYWAAGSDTSHTNSFSMAKTIVSILVGIAVEDKKIKSIDQPVGDFLPEYTEGEKSKITIRHLLTMSSGINFDESYTNPIGFTAEAYFGNDLHKLIFKYEVVEKPGKSFDYLSGNTQLLAFVLNKATGMSLSEYASEKLWKAVEAKYDAYWSLDRENGVEKAYCCFNSNARDFARIGKLYLDSGRWNGKQVVPEKYVVESILPAPTIEKDDHSKNNRYGYSWWLLPDYKGHSVFYARGILGQYIVAIPDLKMIVVRLGEKREHSAINGHPADVYRYIDIALEMYSGK